MTDSRKHDIDDPLERAASLGVIGVPAKKPASPSATQPSRRQDAQTPKRLEVAKQPVPVDEIRKKQTVYISVSLLKWAKHRAVEEDMEISEVVEEALRQLRRSVEERS